MSKIKICDCCGNPVSWNLEHIEQRKIYDWYSVNKWIEGDSRTKLDICNKCWLYIQQVSARMIARRTP